MRALIGRNVFTPVVWDPFAEFERLANNLWRTWDYPADYGRLPHMDVTEEDGSFLIKAELPGVSPDEINITLKDGMLTIQAEHSGGEKAEGNGYHSLSYYRSMTLPENIDPENVTAAMEHGLLEVRLPRTEAIDTKHVEVKALKEPKPKAKKTKRAKNAKKEAKGKK